MTRSTFSTVLILTSVACAGAQRKGAEGLRQADHGLPAATEFAEGPARDAYAAAHAHEAKGDAGAAASIEQARVDWATAAEGYAALAGSAETSEWRIPLRYRAAELLLRAQRFDKAAETAASLAADPAANDASKAIAARLAATAALAAANAAVKAGQLERLELGPTAAKKDGTRPPSAQWSRVVEAVDAYLARAGADPETRRPAGERRAAMTAADLALVAAEVQYACGNLDGARARLEAILDRWPASAGALERAIPLYLGTFAARDDVPGRDAALESLREKIAAEAAKATGPKEKAAFARALEGLGRARAGARIDAAEKLLADGKPAEAAQALEAIAREPGVGEPANVLHNAAVAWDKAGDPAKAAQVRERILKDHVASQVAPDDALVLAAQRARGGDHAASARFYEEFLRRWPDSPSRCVALRNAAAELDLAERSLDAAARYLAFGRDEACAKADPNIAARALVRGGRLLEAQARAAYSAAVALPGVAEADAKNQVSDAKRRLKGL